MVGKSDFFMKTQRYMEVYVRIDVGEQSMESNVGDHMSELSERDERMALASSRIMAERPLIRPT